MKKKQSAGGRIKAQGKSLVWVTLDESDKQKIRVAAAVKGIAMSQFLKDCGLTAADKIIKNLSKTSD